MSQPAFDFGDEPFDDPANPTFTVGELADAINAQLRRGFHDGVWVRGEIQGWSDRGNHAYFSLVDESGDGKAVLNVQFFANVRMKLRPLLQKHRLRLGDGMKVRIFGHLDFYAPTGRIGLKMSGIDPRFTLGELAMARDEVVRRLVASGLFDANKRRLLSPVPLRVGVVTSVGTAAWHDFHHELERSGLGFHLSVVDTRVQGEWAEQMIVAALGTLARRGDIDAIVLIRGGGSRNELATFDLESIAMAIATSPVPVLTGLGHETDRSVADEVAHTSLKTPTACAGWLIDAARGYLAAAESAWSAVASVAERELVRSTTGVSDRAHRIARRTHTAVARADDRLASRVERLGAGARRVVGSADRHVDRVAQRLVRRPTELLVAEQRHVDALAQQVANLDPANLLARGWSITRAADGTVVRSLAELGAGDTIRTQVADGMVTSRVETLE